MTSLIVAARGHKQTITGITLDGEEVFSYPNRSSVDLLAPRRVGDGVVVAVSDRHKIQLFGVECGPSPTILQSYTALFWLPQPDGSASLVYTTNDGVVRICDMATGKITAHRVGQYAQINDACLFTTPEGGLRIALATRYGPMLWDPNSDIRNVYGTAGMNDSLLDASRICQHGNKLLALHMGNRLPITWRVLEEEPGAYHYYTYQMDPLDYPRRLIRSATIERRPHVLMSQPCGVIAILSDVPLTYLARAYHSPAEITGLATIPNGSCDGTDLMVTAGADGSIQTWDLDMLDNVGKFPGPDDGPVRCLTVLPDPSPAAS